MAAALWRARNAWMLKVLALLLGLLCAPARSNARSSLLSTLGRFDNRSDAPKLAAGSTSRDTPARPQLRAARMVLASQAGSARMKFSSHHAALSTSDTAEVRRAVAAAAAGSNLTANASQWMASTLKAAVLSTAKRSNLTAESNQRLTQLLQSQLLPCAAAQYIANGSTIQANAILHDIYYTVSGPLKDYLDTKPKQEPTFFKDMVDIMKEALLMADKIGKEAAGDMLKSCG